MPREAISLAGAEADPDLGYTYNELINELAEQLKGEERPANSTTVSELAAATGQKYELVNTFLNRQVREGKLQSRPFIIGGHWCKVFWKKE